jgi:hypothetical protein
VLFHALLPALAANDKLQAAVHGHNSLLVEHAWYLAVVLVIGNASVARGAAGSTSPILSTAFSPSTSAVSASSRRSCIVFVRAQRHSVSVLSNRNTHPVNDYCTTVVMLSSAHCVHMLCVSVCTSTTQSQMHGALEA